MPCSLHELAALPRHVNQPATVGQHGEAGHRAVVSRAYYAAFHHAMEAVVKYLPENERSTAKGVHKALIENVAAIGDIRQGEKNLWVSLSNKLNTLREKRVVADYRLSEDVDALKALQCVNYAEDFCRRIVKY